MGDHNNSAGLDCIVFDACVNSSVLNLGLQDSNFKLFLVQLTFEWLQSKHDIEFDTSELKGLVHKRCEICSHNDIVTLFSISHPLSIPSFPI